MPATITLTITGGKLKGRQFVFNEPTRCLIGRAECCNVRLPSDEEHGCVSRLHCRLDIDPPFVWLRDLGSRNGTFLNGEKLGQRDEGRSPDEAAAAPSSEDFVVGGDEIRVGNTVLSVEIHWPEEMVPADAPGDELLSVG